MVKAEDLGRTSALVSKRSCSQVQPVAAASTIPVPVHRCSWLKHLPEVPSHQSTLAESEAETRLRQVRLDIVPAPTYDSPAALVTLILEVSQTNAVYLLLCHVTAQMGLVSCTSALLSVHTGPLLIFSTAT